MFCKSNHYLKPQKIHHKALPKVVFNIDNDYDELLQLSKIYHSPGIYSCIIMQSFEKFK